LSARVGYAFNDPELLHRAMSHRSWCAENGAVVSNERLEYLGDSVLGLVVSDHTYTRFPDHSEGSLAKVRAAVVNSHVLADVAGEIAVGEAVLLGRGEDQSGGREKTSILADAFEAVIGAIYVDGGIAPARDFILRQLGSRIDIHAAGPGGHDHKTLLQEITARHFDTLPFYEVSGDGPDHERCFTAVVSIAGDSKGVGSGRTKKQAEQAAAHDAWDALQELDHVRDH
jgi:ribonuclease-3